MDDASRIRKLSAATLAMLVMTSGLIVGGRTAVADDVSDVKIEIQNGCVKTPGAVRADYEPSQSADEVAIADRRVGPQDCRTLKRDENSRDSGKPIGHGQKSTIFSSFFTLTLTNSTNSTQEFKLTNEVLWAAGISTDVTPLETKISKSVVKSEDTAFWETASLPTFAKTLSVDVPANAVQQLTFQVVYDLPKVGVAIGVEDDLSVKISASAAGQKLTTRAVQELPEVPKITKRAGCFETIAAKSDVPADTFIESTDFCGTHSIVAKGDQAHVTAFDAPQRMSNEFPVSHGDGKFSAFYTLDMWVYGLTSQIKVRDLLSVPEGIRVTDVTFLKGALRGPGDTHWMDLNDGYSPELPAPLDFENQTLEIGLAAIDVDYVTAYERVQFTLQIDYKILAPGGVVPNVGDDGIQNSLEVDFIYPLTRDTDEDIPQIITTVSAGPLRLALPDLKITRSINGQDANSPEDAVRLGVDDKDMTVKYVVKNTGGVTLHDLTITDLIDDSDEQPINEALKDAKFLVTRNDGSSEEVANGKIQLAPGESAELEIKVTSPGYNKTHLGTSSAVAVWRYTESHEWEKVHVSDAAFAKRAAKPHLLPKTGGLG